MVDLMGFGGESVSNTPTTMSRVPDEPTIEEEENVVSQSHIPPGILQEQGDMSDEFEFQSEPDEWLRSHSLHAPPLPTTPPPVVVEDGSDADEALPYFLQDDRRFQAYVSVLKSHDEPTWAQALASSDSKDWQEGAIRELYSLFENDAITFVKRINHMGAYIKLHLYLQC
jgi:hypothetical protein